MRSSPEVVVIAQELPGSPEGRSVLRAYFRDIVSRYHGRPATDSEVEAVLRDDPSNRLAPPDGLFLVARQAGDTVGCGGLLLLPGGIGEVKRVFVEPAARGRGVGRRLMRALEDAAREHRVSRLRLDTRSNLTEARRLYVAEGYHEVPPFNDDPMSEHWYEKVFS